MDDAAIHRVPGERTGLAVRLLKVSGSPRLKGLAMTKGS
jgi:hypothetical protein